MRMITQSELKAIRQCERKWWLKYVRRLRKKQFEPSALSMGTYFHTGMEHRDSPGWKVKLARMATDDKLACDELFHKDVDKQHEMAVIMVEGLIEWAEETGLDVDVEVLEHEREVQVDMGDGWFLAGKWDEYIRTKDGRTGYRDYKSVANFPSILKTADMDEQFLTYEVIRRRMGESPSGFGQWVMARKVKRTATAKPPFYDKHDKTFNDDQVKAMEYRIRTLAERILKYEGWAEKDPEAMRYWMLPTPTWDCPRCEFFKVCSMFDDGSAVEEAIEASYEIKDPNERYQVLTQKGEG